MRRVDTMMRVLTVWVFGVAMAGSAVHDSARAQGLSGETMTLAETNFKAADKAATGRLDAVGFKDFIDRNAAARIGRATDIKSNNAYSRAFSAIDANKDGFVTWAEFVTAQRR